MQQSYGPEASYHWPTELLSLLQKCIPLLCPAKRDVFQFFRAAGVDERFYSDWQARWRTDPGSVSKFPVVRDALNRLNEDPSDKALRHRREIVRRVTAWENFSTLWPDDQLKAKGLVADIRRSVNVADSFTKMNQERERAELEKREARRKELEAARAKREEREAIRKEIAAQFTESNHQKRGKTLEPLLNRLFATFDISVRESFTVRGEEGEGIIAQIDGAVLLDNQFYLVEVKWLKKAVGPGDIAQHVMRVLHRGDATRGIFISATDYTSAAEVALREALNYRVHIGIGLNEIIFALEKSSDVRELLRRKVQAAILDKNPLLFD